MSDGRGRRITYDAAAGVTPEAGDVLATIIRSRLWLILEARRVHGRHPNRWALRCEKVMAADGARLLPLLWYPRGPRRRAQREVGRG